MRREIIIESLFAFTNNERMVLTVKIGFLGCGAIGSIYASYMTKAHDVFVCDTFAPVVEAVRSNGIIIDEAVPGYPEEQVVYHPKYATTNPDEIGACDIVIVFVRYMFLEAAMRNARAMVGPDTVVVTLQNGIGNYDEIAKVIPEEQIVIGNTAFGSMGIAPGHVKHTGTGTTNLGSMKAPKESVLKVANALEAAGFDVCVMDNVMEVIWHKLFANVAINAITALLDRQNAFVVDNQYANDYAGKMVNEAITVAIASGCNLDRDEEYKHAFEVAAATGTNRSSMLQDVSNKKETEIKIINGAVCKIGKEFGVETPYNEAIVDLILAKQSIYLGR